MRALAVLSDDFALDIIAATEEPSPGLSATLSHHCVTGEGTIAATATGELTIEAGAGEGTIDAGANGRGHVRLPFSC